MDLLTSILIIIIGLVTGTFGAIVGSSLLIIVPALIFFGLPAHIALGTGKLSALLRDISALTNYHKSKKVVYSVATLFTIFGIIGTIIGALLTLSLSENILKNIILVFVIIMGILILLNPKRGLKSKNIKLNKKSIILSPILGLIIGFYAGIFGGGVNLLIIFLFVMVMELDFLGAVATSKASNLLFLLTFVIIFAINKKIDYIIAIPLGISMFIGGYIGSKIAIKKGNNFIRWLFIGVVFIMAIKLLFF